MTEVVPPMTRATLFAAILLVSGLPLIGATDTVGCNVATYPATQIGDFYNWQLQEIWQESNGVPGLQRTWSHCGANPPIPADTCITHKENAMLVNCLAGYPSTLP